MIRLIPDWIADSVKSQAERELFRKFSNTETEKDFIILHSLALPEHVSNIFGETDFVIICARGVLCVEVKGGAVACSNGTWRFTNRYGRTDTKTGGPFQQAQGNMQSLRRAVRDRLAAGSPLAGCQYACCVIMPQCRFPYRGIEINREILFDAGREISLEGIVSVSFDYWEKKLLEKHGFRGSGLSPVQMEQLAAMLRGDFGFVPSLKDTVSGTVRKLCALTAEQYDILEGLSGNERVLVSGGAGTGKTLLAMEQARRMEAAGQSVLYLCYNRNIAGFVRERFGKEERRICAQTLHAVLAKSGAEPGETRDSDYFEQILPDRFVREFHGSQYDCLIVDEGQDLFRHPYLDCMDKLVKGGLEGGRWLMLCDRNQNIYDARREMDACLDRLKGMRIASYKLTLNCRNTRQIAAANRFMTGLEKTLRAGAEGPKVVYQPYGSPEEAAEILNGILIKLRNDGVDGSDIVILSRYGIENPGSTLRHGRIPRAVGTLKTSGSIWRAEKDEIRFATVASFKGLEAGVVILTDVDSFRDEAARMRNYVAVSRASSLLYVLYDRAREDERQEMLLDALIH